MSSKEVYIPLSKGMIWFNRFFTGFVLLLIIAIIGITATAAISEFCKHQYLIGALDTIWAGIYCFVFGWIIRETFKKEPDTKIRVEETQHARVAEIEIDDWLDRYNDWIRKENQNG